MSVGVFEDQEVVKAEVHFLSSDCFSTTNAGGQPVESRAVITNWQSVGTNASVGAGTIGTDLTNYPLRYFNTRQGVEFSANSTGAARFYMGTGVINTMKRLVTVALIYDYFYTGGYHPVLIGRFTPSTAAGDPVDSCAWQVTCRDTAARFQFSYRGTWYVSQILNLNQPTGSLWVFQFQFEYNNGVMGVRYRHTADTVNDNVYTDLRVSWPSGARVTADVTTDMSRTLTFPGINRDPNNLVFSGKIFEVRLDSPSVLLDSELGRRIYRQSQRKWL